MKDLNNASQARKLIDRITRYQQVLREPEKMWSGISIDFGRNLSAVLFCAGNLDTEEMKELQTDMVAMLQERVIRLNQQLEAL